MVDMYTPSKDSIRVRNKNKSEKREIKKSTPGIALKNLPMRKIY